MYIFHPHAELHNSLLNLVGFRRANRRCCVGPRCVFMLSDHVGQYKFLKRCRLHLIDSLRYTAETGGNLAMVLQCFACQKYRVEIRNNRLRIQEQRYEFGSNSSNSFCFFGDALFEPITISKVVRSTRCEVLGTGGYWGGTPIPEKYAKVLGSDPDGPGPQKPRFRTKLGEFCALLRGFGACWVRL